MMEIVMESVYTSVQKKTLNPPFHPLELKISLLPFHGLWAGAFL